MALAAETRVHRYFSGFLCYKLALIRFELPYVSRLNKVLESGCGAKFKPDEEGPYNCKHNESTDLGSVG